MEGEADTRLIAGRRIRLLALAACPAVMTVALTAQAPPRAQQQPTFRSGVELIQVEVVVTGADGRPVHGLTAADFSILDRGRPQEIAVVEEIRHAPPDAPLPFPPDLRMDVSDNRYGPSERLVILVIDDYNIWRGRSDATKALARQVIEQLSPRASMAVLYTSRTGSTEVTQDRAELFAAVHRLKGRKMVPRPNEWGDGGPFSRVRRVSAERTLADAARFIRSNDRRRKAFIFISETAPTVGTSLDRLDEDPDDGVFRAQLQYLIRTLHEANVSVYALDPRGHITQQEMSRECFPAPVRRGPEVSFDSCAGENWGQSLQDGMVRVTQRSLDLFARTAGGFGIVDTDDFAGGIDRIVEALDNYYLLGFYPTDTKGTSFRRLKVAVDRPDLVVQYRRGYFPPKKEKPPKRPDPAGTLLAAPTPTTDLPVRVFAAALPTGNKNARVIVTTEVTLPGDPLRQGDGGFSDTLSHVLVAGDMNVGKSKKQQRRTVQLSGRQKPGVDGVSFRIQSELELSPGRYQIRSAVLSAATGRGGASYLPIDVPDLRKDSSPLGHLVLMRAAGAVPGEPAPAGLPLPPSLDRAFDRGETLRVYTELTQPGGPSRPALVVFDMEGNAVLTRDVEPALVDGRRHRIDAELPLASLAPGPYRISVRLADGPSRDVGIVVK